ncbi:MAG: hypothetical protein EXS22_07720, partial [Pedosphaera sp.]|nr:hypothetical protein [Pedosphaera sp.]
MKVARRVDCLMICTSQRIGTLSSLLLAVVTSSAAPAPVIKLPPRHDPPDQIFRMAPMPQSSRSIVVRLSDKLHLAYDVERFRVHTAWEGGPLHLFGPGYHGAKEPFICQVNGQRLWGNPPFPEW